MTKRIYSQVLTEPRLRQEFHCSGLSILEVERIFKTNYSLAPTLASTGHPAEQVVSNDRRCFTIWSAYKIRTHRLPLNRENQ